MLDRLVITDSDYERRVQVKPEALNGKRHLPTLALYGKPDTNRKGNQTR